MTWQPTHVRLTGWDDLTEPGGCLVPAEMERRNVPRLCDSFGFQERETEFVRAYAARRALRARRIPA